MAAEELAAHGAARLAAIRAEMLTQALPDAKKAADDRAAVDRLTAEHSAMQAIRDDEHGPFKADRLWLSTLAALFVAALVGALGFILAKGGFSRTTADLVLVLALATVIAFAAGDWAGRARSWRQAAAPLAVIAAALAAACAVGNHHDQRSPALVVDLAVVLTAAGAGVLGGRGRRLAPAVRGAEREHRLTSGIALTREQADRSAAVVAGHQASYATRVEEVRHIVEGGLEEYLRHLDDQRINNGLFTSSTPDGVRQHVHDLLDAWPRELDLKGP